MLFHPAVRAVFEPRAFKEKYPKDENRARNGPAAEKATPDPRNDLYAVLEDVEHEKSQEPHQRARDHPDAREELAEEDAERREVLRKSPVWHQGDHGGQQQEVGCDIEWCGCAQFAADLASSRGNFRLDVKKAKRNRVSRHLSDGPCHVSS